MTNSVDVAALESRKRQVEVILMCLACECRGRKTGGCLETILPDVFDH